MSFFPRMIATFFGLGYAPKGPGTVGSLASLVIWVPLAWYAPWTIYVLTWTALTALGLWASQQVIANHADADPQIIVIDEVSGMGVACFLLPVGWVWAGVAFGLFRLFDIWKIGLVKWADQRLAGALGVMMDDVLAGSIACVVCQGIFRLAST
jgi:phosphatidylglycerophosphatase A